MILPIACDCTCHTNPGEVHFDACCEGTCPECGIAFVRGLAAHAEARKLLAAHGNSCADKPKEV